MTTFFAQQFNLTPTAVRVIEAAVVDRMIWVHELENDSYISFIDFDVSTGDLNRINVSALQQFVLPAGEELWASSLYQGGSGTSKLSILVTSIGR